MSNELTQQLRTRRKELRLRQADVAERLGMRQNYYQRLESGVQPCNVNTLERVAAAVGMKVALVEVDESEVAK